MPRRAVPGRRAATAPAISGARRAPVPVAAPAPVTEAPAPASAAGTPATGAPAPVARVPAVGGRASPPPPVAGVTGASGTSVGRPMVTPS
ncbi:hypothetical protein EAO76_30380 [Streptomyces sp. sk2.1]|nr:hypothetical protein EAO76_30380 [Streptomyces sp. sk2.1]